MRVADMCLCVSESACVHNHSSVCVSLSVQQQCCFTVCGVGLVSAQRAVKWPDESAHMVARRPA